MSLDEIINSEKDDSLFNNIKNDEAAFEAIFKEHFIPLCAFCQYKFGFDMDIAKEVVHISFIKLWETRQSIAPHLSGKAYLYKILINKSLDIIRHDKVKQKHQAYMLQHTSADAFENDLKKLDFNELQAAVQKAVAALPAQMRTVFELSRYEGMKYSEIAGHLNISVKTVETQMSRALAKLRKSLSNHLIWYFIFSLIGILSNE